MPTACVAKLGIPYATAARFERPEPAPPVDFATCTTFGPAPPQLAGDGLVPGALITDQDEHACLTLNVWAPDAPSAPRPVLFVFYGGAFMTGASSQPCFDGARLAREQDVVVVTANYRLGALGFLDLRSLGGDAVNLGLHDALLALRWVHDHISEFGGDPDRVTIMGESAGGGICLHLLASPASRGLFASAIVQSGATDFTLDPDRAAVVARIFCDHARVDDLDALRALPVEQFVAAQGRSLGQLIGAIGMMPFHPCIDGDVVPAAPVASLAAGVAAGVPLLAGTTSDEMRLYLNPNAPPLERAHLVRRVEKYVGISTADAEAMVARYEHETSVRAGDVWAAVFADQSMVAPMMRVLDAQAPHAPVHCYLFTWESPRIGAAHAVDIPFIMGNFVDGWAEFVGHDDDAERLSQEMRTAWASFAASGAPGWAPYPAVQIWGRESRVADAHPFAHRLSLLS